MFTCLGRRPGSSVSLAYLMLFFCCSSGLVVWFVQRGHLHCSGQFVTGCFVLWVDRPLSQLRPAGHEQEGVAGQRSSQSCSETPSSGRHKCGGLKSAPNPVQNCETAHIYTSVFVRTFMDNHPQLLSSCLNPTLNQV